MTTTFNVELLHFDDRYIEDIALTLANELKPLRITRSTLEDLPFIVAVETDARTAFRLQQLLLRYPGTKVDIHDSEDMSKVIIDMEIVTLHYRIAFLESGKSIARENDLVSPLIARRELGLKTPEAPAPDPIDLPAATIETHMSPLHGAQLSSYDMAKLVLEFAEENRHGEAAGEFIWSLFQSSRQTGNPF